MSEEQYPKALGHTVGELDVSEAGTIKVFTVRMGQVSSFQLEFTEYFGSMSLCICEYMI